jgi:nucleoside phosphorylase
MAHIHFIFAMKSELPTIFKPIIHDYVATNHTITVSLCGIGMKNATQAIQKLFQLRPASAIDFIINIGFCGGISDDSTIGDVIIADRVMHRSCSILLPTQPISAVKNLFLSIPLHIGCIESFSHPVFSKQNIKKNVLGADMEGFALAEYAQQWKVPLLMIKVVSDIVQDKLSITPTIQQIQKIKKTIRILHPKIDFIVTALIECDFKLLDSWHWQ